MLREFGNFGNLLLDDPSALLGLLAVIGSALLVRVSPGWPTWLMVIGATAYFVYRMYNLVITWGLMHDDIEHSFYRAIPTLPFGITRLFSVWFAVGFLWYAIRASRKRI